MTLLTAFALANLFGSMMVIGENLPTFDSRPTIHKPLPEPLTSFGATVLGEHLYVFSGHSGDAHGFGKDLLVDHFRRIRFDDPTANWEELAMHHAAQSPGLIHDGQYIYRIGGLSFRNTKDDPKTDFNSTNFFSRFDPQSNQWTELAPLPAPRSSLDAAILGRSVYVAGGWNLQGESSSTAEWHEDLLCFNLDQPDRGWQSLPGPGYKTRAISLAAHAGKLFLIGGIQDRGITRKVSIYDPVANAWSTGPELPSDSSSAGFATSSFAVGGHLYVTGSSGVLYRLNEDGASWQLADRLLYPRMFLRLLPVGDSRLVAVGGTGSGSSRTAVVESFVVAPGKSPASKLVTWSVPYDGRAKHSQTLVLEGNRLYAIGGNASWAPHDFSREAFVQEAFMFDIAGRTATRLPDPPLAMQSGAALFHRQTSEHRVLVVLGGLGFTGDQFGSLDNVVLFDPESRSWSLAENRLSQPRGMFDAVVFDDALWMFGGSDAGKGKGLDGTVSHWWGDESSVGTLPDVQVPHPRRSFDGALIASEYFMIGGLGAGNKIVAEMDVFNLETRSWRAAAGPQFARVFPTVCVDGKRIYLFGGFRNDEGHFTECPVLEVYDLQTGRWSTVAESIPGVDASMRMLGLSGRLLFFGIDRERDAQANFALYDPSPMTAVEQVASMNTNGPRGGKDPVAEAKLLMRKDVNKDGKLSLDELGTRMIDFVTRADRDGDRLLSFEEIKSTITAQAESNLEKPKENS